MMGRIDRILMATLVGCLCMSASSAAIVLASSWGVESTVKARNVTPTDTDGEMIDLPENAAAWLTVEGTPIDLPVAQLRKDDPDDFYLKHDVLRNPSPTGAAYLSRADGPRDPCVRIFGHHLGNTDLIFSPLSDAHDKEVFETLGELSLTDRGGEVAFTPLCALHVDEKYEPIRQEDYDAAGLDKLVTALMQDAPAKCEGAEKLMGNIDRLVVLITCTSDTAGQPERTLIVFAHAREEA